MFLLYSSLILYSTIASFEVPGKKPYENIEGKLENAGNRHFFPFPTIMSRSTFSRRNCIISVIIKLSSAKTCNLDKA